jgi:hypothetical protein
MVVCYQLCFETEFHFQRIYSVVLTLFVSSLAQVVRVCTQYSGPPLTEVRQFFAGLSPILFTSEFKCK